MNINYGKAITGGLAGTAVMTVVGVFLAPMMGMPRMNPADMLAAPMGSAVLGWAGHLMIGTILALIYAAVVGSLPGSPWQRGALFALAPWLLAQLAVMPMMGMGMFSGSMLMAGESLLGHLVYGATLGAIYGAPLAAPRSARA